MKILYLSGGFFPKGSAYASRILNLSRAIQSAGHSVTVLADYGEAVQESSAGEIDGISYLLCDPRKELSPSKLPERFCGMLSRVLEETRFDIVLSSSDHDRFSKVSRMIRSKGLPVILESCEWFGTYNWSYGCLNPRYYGFLYCWNRVYPKADGVIAISRMLESHYRKYTRHVIRIPTVLPDTGWNPRPTADSSIRLIYAGSAGKSKDLLKNVILAISMLPAGEANVKLDIYGINQQIVKKQMGESISVLDSLKDTVVIHGKVKQDEIHDCYCRSDFSILFRPDRRSSHAGFPTKLAESMLAGTPLICNNTGDIGLYVRDSFNGIILDDITPQGICRCLRKLREFKTEEMRRNARTTAAESFLWVKYADPINTFLHQVIEG